MTINITVYSSYVNYNSYNRELETNHMCITCIGLVIINLVGPYVYKEIVFLCVYERVREKEPDREVDKG